MLGRSAIRRGWLEAAKARGTKLGGYREKAAAKLTRAVRAKAAKNAGESHTSRAVAAYADLVPQMLSLKSEGKSLAAIASELNALGHTTRTGAAWGKVQVKRAIDRVGGHQRQIPLGNTP